MRKDGKVIDDIEAFVRKTGRAELDEHAEGVGVTEMIAKIREDTERSREEVIDEISENRSLMYQESSLQLSNRSRI